MTKFKGLKAKLIVERFADMTASQIVEYMSVNPNCEMVQDYIVQYCSQDRAENIIIQAEKLEKENYQKL